MWFLILAHSGAETMLLVVSFQRGNLVFGYFQFPFHLPQYLRDLSMEPLVELDGHHGMKLFHLLFTQ